MFHPPPPDPLLSVAIVTASHPPSIAPHVIQKNKKHHQKTIKCHPYLLHSIDKQDWMDP